MRLSSSLGLHYRLTVETLVAHVLSAGFVMMSCMFQRLMCAATLDLSRDHAQHLMAVDCLTGSGVAGM